VSLDTELLIAEFETANASLAEPTRAVLAGFVADRPRHARFLNTLSMLEHMGSHKIMATQHGSKMDLATLKHLSEEARHAFFFKRHAEREAGRPLSYAPSDLLARPAARGYFLRLEAEIAKALAGVTDSRACYLVMSMIVEFRAVWGYRIYQDVLSSARHFVGVKSLLAEESGHLADMSDRLGEATPLDAPFIRNACAVEHRLYKGLLSAFASAT
jgi:hypothetical protein